VDLHYYDFDPPAGWNGFRAGSQVRLIPPNTPPPQARCAIIVSPLVPRSKALPAADVLIEQTLAAEAGLAGSQVEAKDGPRPVSTTTGLAGVWFDVRMRVKAGLERRIYVMFVDELCYYGISYLADEAVFDEHVETFWTAARSIRPFTGRLVPPSTALKHYTDSD